MRLPSVVLTFALAACGGSKPAAVNPGNQTPAVARDANSVPGLDALVIEMHADKAHCGEKSITVHRVAGKAIPAGDEAIVAVFELQFPTDLNFSEGPQKEASLKKFNGWVAEMTQKAGDATKHYSGLAAGADPAIKAAALARMAQGYRHIANLLAHAAIPSDVSSGEFAEDKTNAYCDKMADVADPIDKKAEATETACRDQAKLATGWWSAVCARNAIAIGEASTVGDASGGGTLDKSIIRRYVRQKLSDYQACYETKLATSPGLGGTVTINFTIDPAGSVIKSDGVGLDLDVASCVANAIKAIKFPKPTGGNVNVSYPFTFTST